MTAGSDDESADGYLGAPASAHEALLKKARAADPGAAAEMPRYQCHKQVWALKIRAIEFADDGWQSAKIAPADAGYAQFNTKDGYRPKFTGNEDDLGYYVVYADGYESWSPTKAFEEGYTRL